MPGRAWLLARFSRILVIAVALLGLACQGSAAPLSVARVDRLAKEAGHLYVCSFNVYRLGSVEAKYDEEGDVAAAEIPERITCLANVLAVGGFDLIVLQEVTEGERGNWALTDLVHELRAKHNLTYKFFLSGGIGQGFNMQEAMAFIYNPQAVTPLVLPGTTTLVENIEIPGRDLVRTKWQAGHFDFTLISAHLAWGNHADRAAGDRKVHDILTTPTPSAYSDDPDIIVLGDFNRFGEKAEFWDGLSYDTAKFFVPNVTIFDPAFKSFEEVKKGHILNKGIPGDNPQLLSTTVADNTFVYDMIYLTADADEEFPGTTTTAMYGKDFGIIHFDYPQGFGFQTGADQLSHSKLKELYSDHRPIWMRFSTTTGNSDTTITTTYVATAKGKKFHLTSCSTIAGSTIATSWSSREEAAKTRGPCGLCKP